jgi:hypothetical protein
MNPVVRDPGTLSVREPKVEHAEIVAQEAAVETVVVPDIRGSWRAGHDVTAGVIKRIEGNLMARAIDIDRAGIGAGIIHIVDGGPGDHVAGPIEDDARTCAPGDPAVANLVETT